MALHNNNTTKATAGHYSSGNVSSDPSSNKISRREAPVIPFTEPYSRQDLFNSVAFHFLCSWISVSSCNFFCCSFWAKISFSLFFSQTVAGRPPFFSFPRLLCRATVHDVPGIVAGLLSHYPLPVYFPNQKHVRN